MKIRGMPIKTGIKEFCTDNKIQPMFVLNQISSLSLNLWQQNDKMNIETFDGLLSFIIVSEKCIKMAMKPDSVITALGREQQLILEHQVLNTFFVMVLLTSMKLTIAFIFQ